MIFELFPGTTCLIKRFLGENPPSHSKCSYVENETKDITRAEASIEYERHESMSHHHMRKKKLNTAESQF